MINLAAEMRNKYANVLFFIEHILMELLDEGYHGARRKSFRHLIKSSAVGEEPSVNRSRRLWFEAYIYHPHRSFGRPPDVSASGGLERLLVPSRGCFVSDECAVSPGVDAL